MSVQLVREGVPLVLFLFCFCIKIWSVVGLILDIFSLDFYLEALWNPCRRLCAFCTLMASIPLLPNGLIFFSEIGSFWAKRFKTGLILDVFLDVLL